ncbi:ATP-binding protein [Ureibacillus sinduriensis]|uniref:Serine/threonine protein kinase n=1 Tax=Ureibacillus sinduriensis BLB-1 = JCM 15800 TaxID=1384057 RepID=A0A0A3HSC1_9BACL|nr:ATP-binding protein [Ureibacillus sinduriensis]KGR75501.1 serine/threonine protein kinase [Ureibacillus sinduriensis BLB-1 = JCM 15800]
MREARVVEIVTELDIVTARKLGRDEAKEIGFNDVDQSRITTAIGELAKNILLYAHAGKIVIEEVEENGLKGIAISSIDKGQGMKDVHKVLEDDYSSTSAGAGLPAVKRLVDLIEIESRVGQGTTIKVVKWLVRV